MHKFQEASIDADHDLIIARFDDMCGIVSQEDYDQAARNGLIASILYYTSEHFAREERLMVKEGYPDLEEHRLAHAGMQQEFHRLLGPLSVDRPDMAADMSMLRQMFLFHILTHDETYGEWLSDRQARTGAGVHADGIAANAQDQAIQPAAH